MPSVVVEKPYKFVPPHRGDWWPSFIQWLSLYEGHLRKSEGVVAHEVRGVEKLQESLAAGHGIMLAPNHCRYADPLVLGFLVKKADTHVFAMASWHLFNMGWFNAFSIQKMGAFSVFREGLDKKSIETAIGVLTDAKRPLVLFAEGATFRANDRLQPMMDGVSFIARNAARRRNKHGQGKVVIHPVAIKYVFEGDVQAWADASLTRIEERLTWTPDRHRGLRPRITRVANALLALKEIEFLGHAQSGENIERQTHLVEAILDQVTARWVEPIDAGDRAAGGTVLSRVKSLRTRMFPELLDSATPEDRKQEIRADLKALELAQQIYSFPIGYLTESPISASRVVETLENMEEGLFGDTSWPGPLKVILEVGEAIEVPAERAPKKVEDPILGELSAKLKAMLDKLAAESSALAESDFN